MLNKLGIKAPSIYHCGDTPHFKVINARRLIACQYILQRKKPAAFHSTNAVGGSSYYFFRLYTFYLRFLITNGRKINYFDEDCTLSDVTW